MVIDLKEEVLISLGLQSSDAESLVARITTMEDSLPPQELWKHISRKILHPSHPFAVHQYLHETVFAKRDQMKPISAPAWFPENPESSNITGLMRAVGKDTYQELYEWSIHDREAFWKTVMEMLDIRFDQTPSTILNFSENMEQPRWLPDARMNIINSCFNARADSPAIIFQKEHGEITSVSVSELRSLTFRVARGLVDIGIKPGNRVSIIMPMTVEASIIYLGAIAAGCAVTTIADIFAPEEIRIRLKITQPVCVFTQDHIQRRGRRRPLYEKVKAAGEMKTIVIPADTKIDTKLRDNDIPWKTFLPDDDTFTPVVTDPTSQTTILFSSGTTADPKAIPWNHLTPIKAAADGYLHHDIHPGDVICWPTNLGWMMGPWLLFASLINRATAALFYGSPTSRQFGQFVERAGVTMLGLVPSLVAFWKSSNCMAGLDWSRIRVFSSTGECSNPLHMLFLMSLAGYKPVIEYCGGTEIGGGYITGTVVQPCIPGMFSTPALGSELIILDEQHQPADSGELYLVPPCVGLSQSLINAEHREVYYHGVPRGPKGKILRRHGDQFSRLPNGYFRARGRVDDAMNLGGIKISSVQIEEIVSTDGEVQEAAAIGVPPHAGGPDRLVVYVVPAPRTEIDTVRLKTRMQRLVREKLSALFKIHEVALIDTLPRTASNKIIRRNLREKYLENEKSCNENR